MRWLRSRENQIWLVNSIAFAVLAGRLFSLTVLQGEEWRDEANSVTIRNISTNAPRGQILDRNGKVLAGNRVSFAVQFSQGILDSRTINDQALQLMNILETNGETINDSLPIVIDEEGNYYFTYDRQTNAWLSEQGLPLHFTAAQAFEEICRRYELDEGLDIFQSQEILISKYDINPPISVRKMEYTYQTQKREFLTRYKRAGQTDEDAFAQSAEEAFMRLRQKFDIETDVPDTDARKIMVIRNELSYLGSYRYKPITVASDIGEESFIVLHEHRHELSAVEVVAEAKRYYPHGTTASHILGYMGKISESEKAEYIQKGYSPSDSIGKEGVEKSFESYLKGTDSVRTLQVDSSGRAVDILGEIPAAKGQDVYLTIDLELQQTAKEALDKALTGLQTGGGFESQWGYVNYPRAYPYANVGTVVAIDVKNGDVLALANSHGFDPNDFVNGISQDKWKELQPDNPRDPLAPRPLYNVAARTAIQPGSSFKMITAIAALENGLDPKQKLLDKGYITVGDRTYGCVSWNLSRRTDGYLDLISAMEVSCNYYFYDISTGKDWANGGRSLGIGEMGIDVITDYAQQFGLGLPTGIEIGESVIEVPSVQQKIRNMESAVRNLLIGRAEQYFNKEAVRNRELLEGDIAEIVSWIQENPSRNELISRLEKMNIREDMVSGVADTLKYSYFNFARWTEGDVMNISIGQGENAYTPLQIANYIATIGNGGVYNKVSVLKAIEGEGLRQREPGVKVNISKEEHLDYMIEGMRRVAHGSKGSARSLFTGFPVQVAAKTGTAQRSGKIPAKSEVEYVKQHLSRINGRLTFAEVEQEMNRLLTEYGDIYTTEDSAILQAVVNLSRNMGISMNLDRVNAYKQDYEDYSWFVALAPADDPQIAVAVLIFQGGTGGYAGPVAREVIGKYLNLNEDFRDYSLSTVINQ